MNPGDRYPRWEQPAARAVEWDARPLAVMPGVAPARRVIPRWLRFLPIAFFLTYLSATVFLFAFGPWPYPVVDPLPLYLFIGAAHLALFLGYRSAIHSTGQGYSGRWSVRNLVVASTAIGIPVLIASLAFRVDISPSDLVGGTATLGDAYKLGNDARAQRTPTIEYIRFFLGPWLALLFPLAVFYWRSLTRPVRVLATLCLAGNIAMFVLTGTNKLIADTIDLLPWLILAGSFAGYIKLRWTGKVLLGSMTAALFVAFLLFFTQTQESRQGGFSVDAGYSAAGNVWADNDNFMIRNLDGSSKRFVLSFVSYLSHGYYGLYLSLRKPFVPTFGVGNSFFLTRQAVRLTGIEELGDAPYPMRIEEDGWDAFGLWSTIYPWIASDVSFPGTLVVVFLIGRFLALSWLDTLHGSNPFAVVMFTQFATMLYYFNANNQCLQSGESLSAFVVLFFVWLETRRKLSPLRRVAWA